MPQAGAISITVTPEWPICFATNSKYKVYVSLPPQTGAPVTTVAIVDTGASTNLVRYEALQEGWERQIVQEVNPRLR